MPEFVFVYGTLRRADPSGMHRLLGRCHAAGEGEVNGVLLPDTEYPALVHSDAGSVRGELYEIDAALLAVLDAYEGAEYKRKRVQVKLLPQGFREAWVYYVKPASRRNYLRH